MKAVNHLYLHGVVVRARVLFGDVHDLGFAELSINLGFGQDRAICLDTSARQTPRLSKGTWIPKGVVRARPLMGAGRGGEGEDADESDSGHEEVEHGTGRGGEPMVVTSTVFALLEMDPTRLRIALIGASRQRHKFGSIILADLLSKGFDVVPVNPRELELGGRPVARSVADVADPLHIVSVVVPPKRALAALEALDPSRNVLVWFQPGAYDQETLALARRRFDHVLAGPCIMVETQSGRRR